MVALLSQLWGGYSRELAARPLRTQVITSGVLYAVGDLLAQKVEHYEHARSRAARRRSQEKGGAATCAPEPPGEPLDWKRLSWSGVFGASLIAPGSHWW